jgi:WhiB family redox-sensing transcriptional regulator
LVFSDQAFCCAANGSIRSHSVTSADLATGLASWVERAACHEMPSEWFYPAHAETPDARDQRESAAKFVCATCDVRVQRLGYALRADERLGIWGGMTERERRDLLANVN